MVPAAQLDAVLAAGQRRSGAEAGMFDALAGGSTTVDLLGLDPTPIEVVR